MAYFRKRENGWEYRISYKSSDGKYKQKSKSGFRTKSEAVQAAAKAELELEPGLQIEKEITFADYFKKWYLIHKPPHISTGTIKHYQTAHTAILKYFGNIQLKSLTPSTYQETLNEMGKHYRKATLRLLNSKYRSCAKYAVMDRIISVNFAEVAKVHSSVPPKNLDEKFLSESEYKLLIEETKNNPFKLRNLQLYLLAVTGMRVGESLGLTWDDVDFEKGELNINKTWDIYTRDKFAKTKNDQSIRTIPIDDDTIKLLREYKQGYWKQNEHNRLFTSDAHAFLNKRIKSLVGRTVHVHSLRHTYVSYLLSSGIEVLTISKLIGHKDPTITLNTYSHLLKEREIEDYQKIKKLFGADLGRDIQQSL